MKTKNNVQKTVTRSAAVIVSFVLISFTVTAQDFWKMVITNSRFNGIALAMTDTCEKPKSQPVNHETWVEKLAQVEEQEQELAVEDWMKESSNFDASGLLTQPETESNLKIEDWMMDKNHFGNSSEIELPLLTEPWMYNERIWTR